MSLQTIVLITLLALLVFWAVGAYNRLVRLKNTIANAFGPLANQFKRRHDLVPGLVEAAKKHLPHEQATLEAVTAARHPARSASDAALSHPGKAGAVIALAAAEQALDTSLACLLALAETCPGLKADPAFRELAEELANTENKAGFARQAYNDAVLGYNQAQRQFPTLVVARLFGFAPGATMQVSRRALLTA